MKKTLFLMFFIFNCKILFSQSAFDYIETSTIKARINPNGSLFYNSDSSRAGFEFPKGSGIYSIYFSGLNFSGLNSINDTMAASSYYTSDYQPGPIMNSIYYPFRAAFWNRVWKVNQSDILYHIANYGSTGYVIPTSIANWPAHGDTTYGEPFYIAPFFDLNGNGIYDPINGDYPKIYGTSCVFQVFNDDCIHLGTGGNKFKIEVHCITYSFECTTSMSLDNCVFIHYDVINRSNSNYFNCSTSLFTDYDLGYYKDDYTGCDVSRGLSYTYNADSLDVSVTGNLGYGSKLPMVGTIVLAGPLADADSFDNPMVNNYTDMIDSNGIIYNGQGYGYGDGIIDNERLNLNYYNYFIGIGAPSPYMSDPNDDKETFNLMHGYWRNGIHLKRGSVGYPGLWTTDTLNCNYSFYGDSDPNFVSTFGIAAPNWNEFDHPNTAGDRRGYNTSGVFTFEAHDTISLDYAIIVAIDSSSDSSRLSAKPILLAYADSIKYYFEEASTPCGDFLFSSATTIREIKNDIQFKVYPNPNNGFLTVEINYLSEKYDITLSNSQGQILYNNQFYDQRQQFDISSFDNGIYFIQISNKNNISQLPILILK